MRKKRQVQKSIEKFKPKKLQTEKAVELMKGSSLRLKVNRIENMMRCGSFLEFLADKEKEKHRLVQANFCRDRFCPMCQWRLAVKEAYMLSVILKAIEKEENKRFIFLTLTVPNVRAEDLNEEIKLLSRSFTNLIKRVNRKLEISKGYVRKIEVTYNEERDDYHPHIHAIVAVNKSYFQKYYYLNQKDWLQLWREVTKKTGIDEKGRDEISQLNVQAVKDLEKSAQEVGKYTVKSMDFLYSQKVFDVLVSVLKGKRLISFGGLFKEYRDKFKKNELTAYMETDLTEYVYRLWMNWKPDKKDYEKFYSELSDEAKQEYNRLVKEKENLGEFDLI